MESGVQKINDFSKSKISGRAGELNTHIGYLDFYFDLSN
jgi:hypothetical protein